MKLKYYLRGLGIGIIITTIVLMIAYSGRNTEMTDEEIIARAKSLGMVMKEDPLFLNSELHKDSETVSSEALTGQETTTETESEVQIDVETEIEPETESEDTASTETEAAPSGDTYHLNIPAGSYPRLICNELQDNGVIADAAALRKYLADMGFATSIHVGEYEIPYGATNEEVYRILKAGPL